MAPKISEILSKMNVNADTAKFMEKFMYKKGECKCLGTCTCTSKDPKVGLTDTMDHVDKMKTAAYQVADQNAYEETDNVSDYIDAISAIDVNRPFTRVDEISKANLGNYIKAAHADKTKSYTAATHQHRAASDFTHKADMAPTVDDKVALWKKASKVAQKFDASKAHYKKRDKGITTALHKLAGSDEKKETLAYDAGHHNVQAAGDKARSSTMSIDSKKHRIDAEKTTGRDRTNLRYLATRTKNASTELHQNAKTQKNKLHNIVNKLTKEEIEIVEAYTAKQLKNMADKYEDKEFEHALEVLKHTTKGAEAAEQNNWKAENEAEMMADGHRRAGQKHGAVARLAGELAWKARELENKKNPPVMPTVEAKPLRKFTVKEEVEQVDEISKDATSDYIHKAAINIGTGGGTLGKRLKGITSATNKLNGTAKVPATPERLIKHFGDETGFIGIDEAYVKQKAYTHPTNGKAAHVGWSSEHREFKVKLFHNGEHQKDADYFTPDKDDAHGTAKHMCGVQNS